MCFIVLLGIFQTIGSQYDAEVVTVTINCFYNLYFLNFHPNFMFLLTVGNSDLVFNSKLVLNKNCKNKHGYKIQTLVNT